MRLLTCRSIRSSPVPVRRPWLILAAASQVVLAVPVFAQGTTWHEGWVGSEWEVYTRALAARGLVDAGTWAIRPVAPAQLRTMASSVTARHPWASRLPRTDSLPRNAVLRPSFSGSFNSAFAWGDNDGAVWQGRGTNLWATAGATLGWGRITARIEPVFAYASNTAFELRPAVGASEFGSDINGIDLPQRPGPAAVTEFAPGNSYVRADVGPASIGLSTANVSWGTGIRHGLLFSANAGGFPHVFAGTNRPVRTPIGAFVAQVMYASLSQSEWAPATPRDRRLGSGIVVAWQPAGPSIEIGAARFYHRFWPDELDADAILAPFGSAFYDEQIAGTGVADNQLAVAFASFRSTGLGLEVFGEFGRNDRSEDLRDLAVEPEHNGAWTLGLLHVTSPAGRGEPFWTTRIEAANARVSRIRDLGRGQAIFYTHGVISQGHTYRGQLLGTPLAEQSGGIELAIDHWAAWGRAGMEFSERQLPGDVLVGMPATGGRSQWDAGASVTLFRGGTDLHAQVGHVWDLNRFVDRDAGNFYLRLGARAATPAILSR